MPDSRHLPIPLQDLTVKAVQDDTVFKLASALAPVKRVGKVTDQFYVYNVDQQFAIENDVRANNISPAKEISLTDVTATTYNLKRHSMKIAVGDADMKNSDPAINPAIDAVQELGTKMQLIKELEVAKTFLTSTSFSVNLATLSSNAWDLDTTTSTPIDDGQTAQEAILKNTGRLMNGLVIGRPTLNVLKDHSDILDRVKWSERGLITTDILASVFDIERVVVSDSIGRTTDEGISATVDFNVTQKALFFYNTPTPGLKTMNCGVTFSGLFGDAKPKLKRWFDKDRDAHMFEMDWMYDTMITQSLSGYLFNAVHS